MKGIQILLTTALPLLFGFGGGAVSTIVFKSQLAVETKDSAPSESNGVHAQKIITAEEVHIIDSEGRIRAKLQIEDSMPTLAFYSKDESSLCRIIMTEHTEDGGKLGMHFTSSRKFDDGSGKIGQMTQLSLFAFPQDASNWSGYRGYRLSLHGIDRGIPLPSPFWKIP